MYRNPVPGADFLVNGRSGPTVFELPGALTADGAHIAYLAEPTRSGTSSSAGPVERAATRRLRISL